MHLFLKDGRSGVELNTGSEEKKNNEKEQKTALIL